METRSGDAARKARKANISKREAAYMLDPKLCLQCGSVIPWRKRNKVVTCSRVCAGYRMHGSRHSKLKPARLCPKCGSSDVSYHATYCSYKCQRSAEWDVRKQLYEDAGEIVGGYAATIRKYLFDVCGNVCSICDLKEWQGEPAPLVADHINGNPEDHRLSNLRLVCPNCDALLPTFKGKNRGNGRWERRNRYYERKETMPDWSN